MSLSIAGWLALLALAGLIPLTRSWKRGYRGTAAIVLCIVVAMWVVAALLLAFRPF
jgi:hypothetical protein